MSKVWVEQLPSGNYSGRYRHPLTGRKERVKGTHPSSDAALAAARKAVRELVRLYDGDPDASPSSGAPSVAECAAEAIGALPHVAPATRRRYHQIATQLVAHFGEKVRVDQLDESSARAVVAAAARDGLSRSTCHGRVAVLGHIVDQAGRDGYTSERSCDWRVPLPSKIHRQRELLGEDTVHLIGTAMPYRLWVAVLISRDTGLRISEVAGLRVADVNLVRRELRLVGKLDDRGRWVAHTKGHRSGRVLPMTARLVEALDSHVRNHVRDGQVWLFGDERGEPVGIKRLRYYWDRARVVAGCPAAEWHDLRRLLLTNLSDEGAPLQVLQELAGHANPTTTRGYVQRIRTEDLARWTSLIDGPDTPPDEPARSLKAL